MAEVFATPQAAEAAFYDAFQRRDLAAMMEVWADDDRVVCIHPGSERLEGRAQVEHSWQQVFSGEHRLRCELSDEQYTQDALLSIHVVRENISVNGEYQGAVLATNIYQLMEGSWHMIVHHASPEPLAAEGVSESFVLH
ncbi:MAG: nuclear transport factor 2 family protein [Gammaproteobacteria bacterium]|nr:nuclear transport factor 2 family protein [Gammaproteobacteria bacterium]